MCLKHQRAADRAHAAAWTSSREGAEDAAESGGEHGEAWLLEQNAWLMEELEAKDGETFFCYDIVRCWRVATHSKVGVVDEAFACIVSVLSLDEKPETTMVEIHNFFFFVTDAAPPELIEALREQLKDIQTQQRRGQGPRPVSSMQSPGGFDLPADSDDSDDSDGQVSNCCLTSCTCV